MQTNFEKVLEFHEKFGAEIGDWENPSLEGKENLHSLRLSLIDEEVQELKDAIETDNIVEVADALGDIAYVVYGAAITYGIDLDLVIEEIHRSNMSKLGADGKPIYREDGKILKGPHYFKPDIQNVLKVQSFYP